MQALSSRVWKQAPAISQRLLTVQREPATNQHRRCRVAQSSNPYWDS